jgi:hypothetical protein
MEREGIAYPQRRIVIVVLIANFLVWKSGVIWDL